MPISLESTRSKSVSIGVRKRWALIAVVCIAVVVTAVVLPLAITRAKRAHQHSSQTPAPVLQSEPAVVNSPPPVDIQGYTKSSDMPDGLSDLVSDVPHVNDYSEKTIIQVDAEHPPQPSSLARVHRLGGLVPPIIHIIAEGINFDDVEEVVRALSVEHRMWTINLWVDRFSEYVDSLESQGASLPLNLRVNGFGRLYWEFPWFLEFKDRIPALMLKSVLPWLVGMYAGGAVLSLPVVSADASEPVSALLVSSEAVVSTCSGDLSVCGSFNGGLMSVPKEILPRVESFIHSLQNVPDLCSKVSCPDAIARVYLDVVHPGSPVLQADADTTSEEEAAQDSNAEA